MNTELINKINNDAEILGNKTTPKSITPQDNGNILLDAVTVFENNERDMLDFSNGGLNTSSKVVVDAINEVNGLIDGKAGLDVNGFVKEDAIHPLWGRGSGVGGFTYPNCIVLDNNIPIRNISYEIEVDITKIKSKSNCKILSRYTNGYGLEIWYWNLSGSGLTNAMTIALGRLESGDFSAKNISNPTNKSHIVLTFTNDRGYIYYNGVLIYTSGILKNTLEYTTHFTLMGNTTQEVTYSSDAIINHFRTFNFPLTAEQVSDLYNGGRYWEKKLGNEWYNGFMQSIGSTTEDTIYPCTSFTKWALVGDTTNLTQFGDIYSYSTKDAGIAVACVLFDNDNIKLKKDTGYKLTLNCRSTISTIKDSFTIVILKGGSDSLTFEEVKNLTQVGEVGPSNSIVEFSFNTNGMSNDIFSSTKNSIIITINPGNTTETFIIDNISKKCALTEKALKPVEVLCKCTSEYLPQSITPTTWFDTSGNGNHIIFSATPEIIYDKPKLVISSDKVPDIVPEFKFQKWIQKNPTTNKSYIYVANNTTKVTDWELIAND